MSAPFWVPSVEEDQTTYVHNNANMPLVVSNPSVARRASFYFIKREIYVAKSANLVTLPHNAANGWRHTYLCSKFTSIPTQWGGLIAPSRICWDRCSRPWTSLHFTVATPTNRISLPRRLSVSKACLVISLEKKTLRLRATI